MKLKNVETADELEAAIGVPCELVWKNKVLLAVKLGGATIRIESYNLVCEIPAPPEKVERWIVQVTHPNFDPVIKAFEYEHEANNFMYPYEAMSDAEIKKEKATVFIDEAGNILDIGMSAPAHTPTNDLPF